MPSTYTLNNGIELIGTGEQSGTWGDTTNINFQLVDTALDGQVSISLTSTGSSGSPNTLPISDGASSNGRNRLVIFGDGGDLGGTAFVQLTPNDAEKIIYVRNNLSGSRSILLFQGTYSASNDYEVPAGTTAVVFFNGAGTGAVAANVFNNAFFDSLRLGGVSVTAILDEDNMSSDSATALATQQSIKKYVDDKAAAQDTLAEVLANGNTTGGTNIQMTTTDELQFRDTALKISSSADGKLDIDADTEIEIVAPTVDIDASTAMTIDTAALTVTGAVDLNTSLNVDGTVTSDGVTVAGNLSVDGGTIKLDGNYPTGTNNVALGDAAGDALASGGNLNVAVGSNALSALVTGDDNVAVGAYALDNVTGADNVGVGSGSLGNSVNSASQNVGLGSDSLTNLASAAYNTAIGHEAGNVLGDVLVATALVSGVNYTIQTLGTTDFTLIGAGSNSVGVSFTATGAGSGTGTASANANYNTFVGHQAGDVIVGGSKNSILGRFDGNQNTIDIRNSDNNIVLSDGDGNPRLAYVSANTELVINEQSADVDFRVESNAHPAALFVDGGTDGVGINSSAPISFANGQTVLFVEDTINPSIAISDTGQDKDYYIYANGSQLGIAYADGSNTGGVTNATEIMNMSNGADGVIFNEGSADRDFRVESDSSTHALFVDAGNNVVGMGLSNPNSYYSPNLVLAVGDNGGITIRNTASTTGTNYLMFADGDSGADRYRGMVQYTHNDDRMVFSTNATGRLELSEVETVFNNSSADTDFRVESDGSTHMLFLDAGNNRIGINQSSPTSLLDVAQENNTNSIISARFNASNRKVGFQANNSNGQAYIGSNINSVSGSANSTYDIANRAAKIDFANGIEFYTAGSGSAGATVSFTNNLEIDTTGSVFNEAGVDLDFRVESDSNDHMLFVDSSANKVSIGSSSFNYGSGLTVHANDGGGAPTSLFLRNSGTSSGSGATIQFGYTSGYGAQIRFSGNPSSYRMASTTFATVTGDGTTQDNVQISTSGDMIVYNDLGVGHSGDPNYTLDVEAEVSGDWLSQFYNTHTSNGYGLKVRAGDNGDVTSFRVSSQSNANTLLNVYGDGNVSKPNTTCFLGYNTAQQNDIAVSTNVTVVLDAERFDQGSDFGSNVYVAPLDGKYLFSYSVYLKNVDTAAAYTELRLVTSNRVYDTIISPKFTADPTYMVLNGSVIADMETGDQCFLRVVLGGGAVQVDIGTGTWLSGTLIA